MFHARPFPEAMRWDLQTPRYVPRSRVGSPTSSPTPQGCICHCMPTGARYWRLRYRYASREKLLAIGVYPEV
jgi:hypothetical protein